MQRVQPPEDESNELTFLVSSLNAERNKKTGRLWAVAASVQAVVPQHSVPSYVYTQVSYAMVTGRDKAPKKEKSDSSRLIIFPI